MTRQSAIQLLRDELDRHNLSDWHIRLTTQFTAPLGLCSYKDKCIILNGHHIDTHPDEEIIDTIKHEVAHALTPGAAHSDTWKQKAIELGARPEPCVSIELNPDIIDAIRSGANVEITFETETKTIIKPKYEITQLKDKCPFCHSIAIVDRELLLNNVDPFKPDEKFIYLKCGHLIVKKIPKGTPFHTISWGGDKSCKHDFLKNTCKLCGAFRPYEFQVEGMKFIETSLAINKGSAIFDEMGLGKTIQALGYIKFHPECLPVLCVVKSAIKFQWFKQFLTILGDEYVGQIIQGSNDFIIPNLKIYIISYDMMVFKTRKSKKTGKEIKQGFDITKFDGVIKTVILDECQQIKNPDSSRTQQVRRIVKDKQVIALSGTPWKNRGSEFFSILNMMAPMKFPSYARYIDTWVEKYWEGNKQKEGGIKSPKRFKEYISDIAIRRERVEVMSELPLISRMRLYIQLDELSQDTYDSEESSFVAWYNDKVIGGEEDSISSLNILAQLSRMRHITGLAKIPATTEFTEQFAEETDRKLIIGVHHKDVGSILYDKLQTQFGGEIRILKLTGEQSSEERFHIQENFNKPERVFLVASTLASGEGINLQTCSDAVLHERQWNPANEEQFEGRMIRIGQKAEAVNCTYVTGEGTIDDLFDTIIERKRNSFHLGMNNSDAPQWNQGDLAKELAQAIIKRHKEKNKHKVKTVATISQMVKL